MKSNLVAILLGVALAWSLGQAGNAQADGSEAIATAFDAALPQTLLTENATDALLERFEAAAAAGSEFDRAESSQRAASEVRPASTQGKEALLVMHAPR
jgi:hypothetical protein